MGVKSTWEYRWLGTKIAAGMAYTEETRAGHTLGQKCLLRTLLARCEGLSPERLVFHPPKQPGIGGRPGGKDLAPCSGGGSLLRGREARGVAARHKWGSGASCTPRRGTAAARWHPGPGTGRSLRAGRGAKGLKSGRDRGGGASGNPPGCAEEGAAGGCGARRRAGRGRGQSGGGPGARGARRHGGWRGGRQPLTRRSIPVVGEAEPAGAPRRGDEQVGGAPALPAGLPRLEGGDQDAAGAGCRGSRWVRGGAGR